MSTSSQSQSLSAVDYRLLRQENGTKKLPDRISVNRNDVNLKIIDVR